MEIATRTGSKNPTVSFAATLCTMKGRCGRLVGARTPAPPRPRHCQSRYMNPLVCRPHRREFPQWRGLASPRRRHRPSRFLGFRFVESSSSTSGLFLYVAVCLYSDVFAVFSDVRSVPM